MSKLLISPNLMFQFATQIKQLDSDQANPEKWKLASSFAMPDLTKWLLSTEGAIVPSFRLAWTESGIYMQSSFTKQEGSLQPLARTNLRFWIDTRGAVANKRLTKFCHLIDYYIDWTDASVTQKMTSGKSTLLLDDSSTKTVLKSQVGKVGNELQLKSFIPAELMQGYQPTEFPQISFFYDFSNDSQPRINAGTDSRIRYDLDPSVWTLARLV
jgi:hypothetical protein